MDERRDQQTTSAEQGQTWEVDTNQVRLIVSRLQEVARKCRAQASKNQEFAQVTERLLLTAEVLQSWLNAPEERINFRDLAASLVDVERVFESYSMVNVARVVASIEESLIQLEKPAEPSAPTVPRRFAPPPSTSKPVISSAASYGGGEIEVPEGFGGISLTRLVGPYLLCCWCLTWVFGRRELGWQGISAVVMTALGGFVAGVVVAWVHQQAADMLSSGGVRRLVGMLLFVGVIVPVGLAGAVSLVLLVREHTGDTADSTTVVAQATPLPTPTRVPTPMLVSAAPVPTQLTQTMLEKVPEEIEQARAALRDGDIDAALDHFGKAVAIDPHHRLVPEAAGEIVDAMIEVADAAADQGLWDEAAKTLDEARRLAVGFYLDTKEIELAAERHAAMVRFKDIRPTSRTALAAARGKRVRITLNSGEMVDGRISELQGSTLLVTVLSGVGGGQVSFTKEYALGSIREIRVYER